MDSHKCGCRWNIGSCGHNQTFFSQIPTATLRHHVQHLAQKTRHLFNFPVHQTAPKTMPWRPQTNASNGQLPPRGRGTWGGEKYIYIYIIIIIIIIITEVYTTTECHDTDQCKHMSVYNKGKRPAHHSWSQGQMPYIPSPKKTQETPQG